MAAKRTWPLSVRRARAADEAAVLSFATNTWNGWDYMPHAFPRWLDDEGGVMVVGVAPPGATDAEGAPLEPERAIAVVRIASPSPSEAWLEGIRVDPRVRGMDIATDLQVAELQIAAARGAQVVRYATSIRNEASHRLGARGGFEKLVAFHGHWWSPSGEDEDDDASSPSGFLPEIQAAAEKRRKVLLGDLMRAGLVAGGEPDELWQRVAADPTFVAAARLYEPRGWAMQELTAAAFALHHERGEVLLLERDGGWAVAILVAEQGPTEDAGLRFAYLGGTGPAALALLEETRRLADEPVFFRVAQDAPLVNDHEAAFRAANYVFSDWALHILGRPLDAAHPPPPLDPQRVQIADADLVPADVSTHQP